MGKKGNKVSNSNDAEISTKDKKKDNIEVEFSANKIHDNFASKNDSINDKNDLEKANSLEIMDLIGDKEQQSSLKVGLGNLLKLDYDKLKNMSKSQLLYLKNWSDSEEGGRQNDRFGPRKHDSNFKEDEVDSLINSNVNETMKTKDFLEQKKQLGSQILLDNEFNPQKDIEDIDRLEECESRENGENNLVRIHSSDSRKNLIQKRESQIKIESKPTIKKDFKRANTMGNSLKRSITLLDPAAAQPKPTQNLS